MSTVAGVIMNRVNAKCLGNSKRGLKELTSDCINQLGKGQIDEIAKGAFLCKHTVERVMECEELYAPRADTLERLLRYCGAEIEMNTVSISPRFRNKPKEDV